MASFGSIGRVLILAGLGLTVVGLLLTAAGKWPSVGSVFGSAFGWIGKLPGDLSITRERFSLYVPLATSLVLSALLSLVFVILSWLFRR